MKARKIKKAKNLKKPIIIFILVAFAIVFITLAFSVKKDEKYCKKDDDCVGVYKGCCNICGGYNDALNKEGAAALKLKKKIECLNIFCPIDRCMLPLADDVPVCKSNRCELEKRLSCYTACYEVEYAENLTQAIEWLDQRLLAEDIDMTAQEAIIFCDCEI